MMIHQYQELKNSTYPSISCVDWIARLETGMEVKYRGEFESVVCADSELSNMQIFALHPAFLST
jgi:hypothetical protein